jgi:hypothetical protein
MQFEHKGGNENNIFSPKVDPIKAQKPDGMSNLAFFLPISY